MIRLPAEWEPHESTWLVWPHNSDDFPKRLASVQATYLEFIKAISQGEEVNLVVEPGFRLGSNLSNCNVVELTTNRSWIRDSGPTTIFFEGKRKHVKWHFNAWSKYDDYEFDRKIPEAVALFHNEELIDSKIVLEGGAFDTNGAGRLLVTEECLLSEVQVRNQGFSKSDYEQVFKNLLGISETIWLPHGILHDDTHGHIDDTARFVSEDRLLLCTCAKNQPNYRLTSENKKRLLSNYPELEVVELPLPEKDFGLPASYANFYVTNYNVIVPTFRDANDKHAIEIISSCFPEREVIDIDSVDLIIGRGSFHCSSQQVPRLRPEELLDFNTK